MSVETALRELISGGPETRPIVADGFECSLERSPLEKRGILKIAAIYPPGRRYELSALLGEPKMDDAIVESMVRSTADWRAKS